MAVIEVEKLRKVYRRRRRGPTVALDDLSFVVPEGGVFGFLGPNGSGKTTTIRTLLGLVGPTDGRCRILGEDPQVRLDRVVGRVGSLVEEPALFKGFSGRRNLRLLAGIDGIADARVDEVLDRVGLSGRADDLVKTYSLGMRQRLGIAAALLKDPVLLILDEPANGLDPAGIKEVRELLRSLADEGRTVFISSHLLAEVEQICDHVAILRRGRCVVQGPVAEVLRSRRSERMFVSVDDIDRAFDVLVKAGMVVERNGTGLHVGISVDRAAEITRVLATKRMYVRELRPDDVTLEEAFLELTTEEDDRP